MRAARIHELRPGDSLAVERYARCLEGELSLLQDVWVEYLGKSYRVYAQARLDSLLVLEGLEANGEWVEAIVVFNGRLVDMQKSTLASYLFFTAKQVLDITPSEGGLLETYYSGS